MAAPETMPGALGRKGVRLGMSLSSLPSAPVAPSGQSGMGAFVCACASKAEPRRRTITKRPVSPLTPALSPLRREGESFGQFNPKWERLFDKRCIKEGVKLFKDM